MLNISKDEFLKYYFSLPEEEKQELREFAKGTRKFISFLEESGEIEK